MEVSNEFGDQVAFIGMPGLSDPDAMAVFVERTGVQGLLHLPDTAESGLWARFGVNEQRTYLLINQDGDTVRTGYGNLRNDVIDLIER